MPATITHRFPRYIALPAVSRPGSSAAPGRLGMAGMANAKHLPFARPDTAHRHRYPFFSRGNRTPREDCPIYSPLNR